MLLPLPSYNGSLLFIWSIPSFEIGTDTKHTITSVVTTNVMFDLSFDFQTHVSAINKAWCSSGLTGWRKKTNKKNPNDCKYFELKYIFCISQASFHMVNVFILCFVSVSPLILKSSGFECPCFIFYFFLHIALKNIFWNGALRVQHELFKLWECS